MDQDLKEDWLLRKKESDMELTKSLDAPTLPQQLREVTVEAEDILNNAVFANTTADEMRAALLRGYNTLPVSQRPDAIAAILRRNPSIFAVHVHISESPPEQYVYAMFSCTYRVSRSEWLCAESLPTAPF